MFPAENQEFEGSDLTVVRGSLEQSLAPSSAPSARPSIAPTSVAPSAAPSARPSAAPSALPTDSRCQPLCAHPGGWCMGEAATPWCRCSTGYGGSRCELASGIQHVLASRRTALRWVGKDRTSNSNF